MRRMALAVLLAALTIPAAGYAQELVSIADIRRQAKEMGRWTQTYHAYGRTIEVDIPIIVPQVERCPVATVEAMQPFTPEILQRIQENSVMNPQDTREYLYTITEEDGLPERMGDELEFLFKNNATDDTFSTEASQARWLSLSYNSKAYAFFASGSGYAYDLRFAWEMDENTAYAEDNPLTYGEALRITEEIFSGLYPQGENVGIQAYQVFANHRMRKANGQSGVKGDPLEGSPIGSYTIDCYQTLYGLPIGSTITGGAAMDGHTVWPGFNMTGIRSERAFSVYGDGLVKARELVYEDVPLAPLDDVITAIEEAIDDGHIRKVHSLELGYILCSDVQSDEFAWAYPAWLLRCVYVSNPEKDMRQNSHTGVGDELYYNDYEYEMVPIYAQTAELKTPAWRNAELDKGRGERFACPQIIAWFKIQ